jgi:Recombination endonuclease VII
MPENAERRDARNARRRQRYAQDPVYRASEKARCHAHYQAHKQECSERVLARYHAQKHDSASPFRKAQLKRYGISPAEYDVLLAKQNGACAICRRRPKGRLCVDHCNQWRRATGCNGVWRRVGARVRAGPQTGPQRTLPRKTETAGAKPPGCALVPDTDTAGALALVARQGHRCPTVQLCAHGPASRC